MMLILFAKSISVARLLLHDPFLAISRNIVGEIHLVEQGTPLNSYSVGTS